MSVTSTQGFVFRLMASGSNGWEQLDLFQDEEIKISNNVTGLFDVSLLPSDFTRQITVPGTPKNNKFFEYVYDISVINPYTFATNVKVPSYLDFNGIYVSQGYLQLNKVNITANKFVDSYEVSIYGALSSFSRDANRLFLTDITTLTQYNHTSSFSNISASWNSNLFGGDIVYPFADYGSDWQYTQGDNYFGVDDPYGGTYICDWKPAIKMKVVWDAIFNQLGYTYDSNFLNQYWISSVYMICNTGLKYPVYDNVDLETYGQIKIGAISGSGMTDVSIPNTSWTTLPWFNSYYDPNGLIGVNASYSMPISSSLALQLNINVNVSSSVNNLPTSWSFRMIETGSGAWQSTTLPNFNDYFTNLMFSRNGSINDTVELSTVVYLPAINAGTYQFQIEATKQDGSLATPTIILDPKGTTKSYLAITKLNNMADGRVMNIANNMPYGTAGIKIIDWLKGIQKKFNLVMQPDNTRQNHFIIETFNDWYRQGSVKSFDRYVNLDTNIAVTPANNLAVNQLNFGDTLDTDYVSQQFYKGANREYGKQYYIDTQNFFSQGTFDVKTTFGNGPLIYVNGTGLSGSAGGITPPVSMYSAGRYYFTNTNSAQTACSSPIYIEIFTNDGNITAGQIAYLDQYGQHPVTGFYFFSNTLQIYPINVSTGVISVASALCRR